MNTRETNSTVYLSREGRKNFKKAIKNLEKEQHGIITELHEHNDRAHSREGKLYAIEQLIRLDAVETEIAERREILRTAKSFPSRKKHPANVSLGSEVELISTSGEHFVYRIVDVIEADPSRGKISIKSPLGRVLAGKKQFDTFDWPDAGKRHMRLLHIS